MCKWKRPAAADALHDFLFEVNERYSRLGGVMATDDINELVPLDVIRSAPDFVKYMTESNEQYVNAAVAAVAVAAASFTAAVCLGVAVVVFVASARKFWDESQNSRELRVILYVFCKPP